MIVHVIFSLGGLTNPLCESLPFDSLPKAINTTLLTFKDKIIYVGIFSLLEIKFPDKFVDMIEKELKTAKIMTKF